MAPRPGQKTSLLFGKSLFTESHPLETVASEQANTSSSVIATPARTSATKWHFPSSDTRVHLNPFYSAYPAISPPHRGRQWFARVPASLTVPVRYTWTSHSSLTSDHITWFLDGITSNPKARQYLPKLSSLTINLFPGHCADWLSCWLNAKCAPAASSMDSLNSSRDDIPYYSGIAYRISVHGNPPFASS
ncbi:hypothetical protein BDN72DRAFT_966415 [Pluteus cervinus]|uniref:Uncharacterized protein n=2 Tax=Pluteus cervinus TaxID=181527 RepID=A0ACD2ZXK9_9AGAR|nr:hypothetical protein BDN72DRAFT_966419 [Pluteus cervinus]TFK58109.1 hypothetical protein BDN72DRAFT_966415 [Pluteus cervinus]